MPHTMTRRKSLMTFIVSVPRRDACSRSAFIMSVGLNHVFGRWPASNRCL